MSGRNPIGFADLLKRVNGTNPSPWTYTEIWEQLLRCDSTDKRRKLWRSLSNASQSNPSTLDQVAAASNTFFHLIHQNFTNDTILNFVGPLMDELRTLNSSNDVDSKDLKPTATGLWRNLIHFTRDKAKFYSCGMRKEDTNRNRLMLLEDVQDCQLRTLELWNDYISTLRPTRKSRLSSEPAQSSSQRPVRISKRRRLSMDDATIGKKQRTEYASSYEDNDEQGVEYVESDAGSGPTETDSENCNLPSMPDDNSVSNMKADEARTEDSRMCNCKQVASLQETIALLEDKNEKMRQLILEAEEVRSKNLDLKHENTTLKEKIAKLENSIK